MAAAGSTRRTTTPRNGVIDLSDKYADMITNAKITKVAGTIKLGDEKFRILEGVNSYKVLKVSRGDTDAILALFEDFIHEDDRDRFAEWINSRHEMTAENLYELLMDLYEQAAGRPTTSPSG